MTHQCYCYQCYYLSVLCFKAAQICWIGKHGCGVCSWLILHYKTRYWSSVFKVLYLSAIWDAVRNIKQTENGTVKTWRPVAPHQWTRSLRNKNLWCIKIFVCSLSVLRHIVHPALRVSGRWTGNEATDNSITENQFMYGFSHINLWEKLIKGLQW